MPGVPPAGALGAADVVFWAFLAFGVALGFGAVLGGFPRSETGIKLLFVGCLPVFPREKSENAFVAPWAASASANVTFK